jgi:hypothetical protein
MNCNESDTTTHIHRTFADTQSYLTLVTHSCILFLLFFRTKRAELGCLFGGELVQVQEGFMEMHACSDGFCLKSLCRFLSLLILLLFLPCPKISLHFTVFGSFWLAHEACWEDYVGRDGDIYS